VAIEARAVLHLGSLAVRMATGAARAADQLATGGHDWERIRLYAVEQDLGEREELGLGLAQGIHA